jgi:hypothetical protein
VVKNIPVPVLLAVRVKGKTKYKKQNYGTTSRRRRCSFFVIKGLKKSPKAIAKIA